MRLLANCYTPFTFTLPLPISAVLIKSGAHSMPNENTEEIWLELFNLKCRLRPVHVLMLSIKAVRGLPHQGRLKTKSGLMLYKWRRLNKLKVGPGYVNHQLPLPLTLSFPHFHLPFPSPPPLRSIGHLKSS